MCAPPAVTAVTVGAADTAVPAPAAAGPAVTMTPAAHIAATAARSRVVRWRHRAFRYPLMKFLSPNDVGA
ncbi:hypothetical protein GCM10022379_58660 [Micromonospora maritima]